MKKRLVTYLLISAMAATVFAGCSKSGGDAAGDAAPADATEAVETVVEEAAEEAAAAGDTASMADLVAAAEAAETAEAAAVAGTSDAAEADEIANEEADVTEEYADDVVDEEKDEAEAVTDGEDLIVDPGTDYTVRFGGNVYATPDQVDSNIIDYVYPGYLLHIEERLDDFWYNVSYWIDGYVRTGYIKIQ